MPLKKVRITTALKTQHLQNFTFREDEKDEDPYYGFDPLYNTLDLCSLIVMSDKKESRIIFISLPEYLSECDIPFSALLS